jgi:hypothetical protein
VSDASLVCHTRFGHRLGNEPELGSSSFIRLRSKTIVASQSPISVVGTEGGGGGGNKQQGMRLGCVGAYLSQCPRKDVRSDGKQCRLRLSSNQPEGDCQVTTSEWIHIP